MEELGQGLRRPPRVYQGAGAGAEASEALAPQSRVVLRVIAAALQVLGLEDLRAPEAGGLSSPCEQRPCGPQDTSQLQCPPRVSCGDAFEVVHLGLPPVALPGLYRP